MPAAAAVDPVPVAVPVAAAMTVEGAAESVGVAAQPVTVDAVISSIAAAMLARSDGAMAIRCFPAVRERQPGRTARRRSPARLLIMGGYQGVGSRGPTLGPIGEAVVAPSPLRRNGRCHRSYGMSRSPGLTFSGKMKVNVGAVYSPAISPFAVFAALLRQVSRLVSTALPLASLTWACGGHSDRTATRTVRVGWLSSPAGALVARSRAR